MVTCQCDIFLLKTYKRRALSCCHPSPSFLFRLTQKPPTFLLPMLSAKVTNSVSASSSLTVSHQPLHKNCTGCLPLEVYSQEPSLILPYTKHLATRFLACLSPYENHDDRVSSASLNLSQDLCPSSPLLYPREHTCKEGTWLYTRAGKTNGKTSSKTEHAKDCIQSTELPKRVSMTRNSHGEGRQQIVGWKEANRIQKF